MRKIILFAPALLSACSTAPAQPVVHGETPGHTCQDQGTDAFIGKPGTRANGSAIKRVTNAAVLRWAPPGVMLTMDFRADRVTVWLGPDKRITKIHCG
jgi:hypothetical protein